MTIPIHWWLGCGCHLVNSFRWLALVSLSSNQLNMLISTQSIGQEAQAENGVARLNANTPELQRARGSVKGAR
jgi:hypothetical protein